MLYEMIFFQIYTTSMTDQLKHDHSIHYISSHLWFNGKM